MASLIPDLSEKAMIEIAHIETFEGDFRINPYDPFGNFKAFQKLFDLEIYPITAEQIVEYLEGNDSFNKKYDYKYYCRFSDTNEKEGSYYEGIVTYHCIYPYIHNIDEILKMICEEMPLRDIDVIAEIHGWW